MDTIDKILKLAQQAREKQDYKICAALTKVAVDVGFADTHKYLLKQLKTAHIEVKKMQKQMNDSLLFKSANDLDAIAKDLEQRIIVFEMQDPIESILSSYKMIHKIAKTSSPDSDPTTVSKVRDLVETSDLPDSELIKQIEKLTMGLPLVDKQNLAYLLEKEYNLTIPFEKLARLDHDQALIKNPETEEEKQHNKQLVDKILEKYRTLSKEEREKFKLPSSFPSEPYMWSGFAYEAIVPYEQSSQVNYWSLASNKSDKILSKIAKTPKK